MTRPAITTSSFCPQLSELMKSCMRGGCGLSVVASRECGGSGTIIASASQPCLAPTVPDSLLPLLDSPCFLWPVATGPGFQF